MKRALAMALGAMMVAGSAAPAAAASHIDFSGYYRAYYGMDNNLGRQAGDSTFSDSYFGHRLNLDVTFTPTDEIAVYWRLRGPHFQRWGTGGAAVTTRHIYGEIKQDWGTVLVGKLHEDLDYWGLANLGYVGGFDPIFSALSPFDDASPVDGIRYTNRWDNGFQLIAQYSKMAAENWTGGQIDDVIVDAAGNYLGQGWDSDRDYDRIEAEGAYFWDGGGASLGVRYDRDAFAGRGNRWGENIGQGMYEPGTVNAWYLNPAIMHSWGDFSVHFEGKLGWGTTNMDGLLVNNPGLWDIWAADDRDSSGYGFYLDLDYNYGPGNVTLAGWWVQGTDLNDNVLAGDNLAFQDNESLVDMGANFIPLVVAYGDNAALRGRVGARAGSANAVSLANNGYENYVLGSQTPIAINNSGVMNFYNLSANAQGAVAAIAGLSTGGNISGVQANNGIGARTASWNAEGTGMANHWGITLGGNHAFTDDISMHYAVGYLALNNPNYRVANSIVWDNAGAGSGVAGFVEQDKDLGYEVDLGFTFQLLDNLRFTTMFGYMFTGDAFKSLQGYTYTETNANGSGVAAAVWADGDDAYVWENTLQFNF